MRKQLLFSLVYTLPILMSSSVRANEYFSMDDINSSLQIEYQSQLVLQPKRKVQSRKKSVVKPQKRVVRQTQPRATSQVQRRAIPPSVRKPTAKAPIPHADELFGAATNGNVNLIARLLQQGVNVNVANSERETALHMAAANGRYSAVIYLINHGANIHFRTIKNWLPIHHATRFRKANIANYLMQKGSSPHARTSDGLSAIDMARTMGNQQLLGLFGAR